MTEHKFFDDGYEEEVRPLQRDDYAVRAQPTWKDVGDRMLAALKGICVAPLELAADVFEGAGKIVRGLSSIPQATAARIRPRITEAHELASCQEDQAQLEHDTNRQQLLTDDQLDNVQTQLAKLKANGVGVQVQGAEDGRILIALTRPEDLPATIEDAKEDEARRLTNA